MPLVKYIADGFLSDAKKLLDEFILESSMEFTVFASIWKKHHFSLIYMGRPTKKEAIEFTNEIFFLTGKYLIYKSRIYQVGGIYLWYSLYLNQIIEPPIRIRITLDQAEILTEISEFAKVSKQQSLLYVLCYLFDNAFEFVALPTLMGPLIRKGSELSQEQSNAEEFELDDELMGIKQSGLLEEIYETVKEYSKFRRIQNPTSQYKEFINQLNHLSSVDVGNSAKKSCKPVSSKPGSTEPGSSKCGIGSRRAQLKSAAFERTILHYQDSNLKEVNDLGSLFETEDESSAPQPIPKEIHNPRRRVPKQEKKVGRPKKNALEMWISNDSDSNDNGTEIPNSNLLSISKNHRYEKVRRIRRYYEENSDRK